MSANISHLPQRNLRARSGEGPGSRDFVSRAEVVAAVAERFADAVDRDARFPAEAFAAIREQKLLGMLIPVEYGGAGARAADVADVCVVLGRACSATAMIFAMHQVKVACLVRHAKGNPWQIGLQRRIAERQMLLASSTTEGNNGGDIRSSEAAIRADGARIALERNASVISYGEHADGLVTTARRSESAASSDQVLVAFLRGDYTLEKTQSWDTLGMRGTCSVGFIVRAEGESDQVLPEPYERIHNQTMAPYAHLFWSSAWLGVATGAVRRARAFVRKAARSAGGRMPPAASHLTKARVSLETLRGAVKAGLATFERHAGDPGGLTAIDAQLALNFLKVEASEIAVQTVMSAMRACGLAGYRNDGDFTMGRYLRDILSSPIMINNDRILANAEAATLMSEPPLALTL
ncbi:MAG: acyl-CoA/acyl-ACP dehydrogenase [Hyphomicrobiales bacterium]|nr:acyl-CoA/acyl-ACP dehydrogenase [Hyphomicrobiales bacterium]